MCSIMQDWSENQDCGDNWTVREQLCLASAVSRNGDQNWNAISRAINLLTTETSRPVDWYSARNCALQYNSLVEELDTAKRKKEKGDNASSIDKPADILLKQLNKKYVERLQKILEEEKASYELLRKEIQLLESDQCDETKFTQFWEDIVKEQEVEEEAKVKRLEWEKARELRNQQLNMKQTLKGHSVSPLKITTATSISTENAKKEQTSSENSSEMDTGDEMDTDTAPVGSASSGSSVSLTPKSSPDENTVSKSDPLEMPQKPKTSFVLAEQESIDEASKEDAVAESTSRNESETCESNLEASEDVSASKEGSVEQVDVTNTEEPQTLEEETQMDDDSNSSVKFDSPTEHEVEELPQEAKNCESASSENSLLDQLPTVENQETSDEPEIVNSKIETELKSQPKEQKEDFQIKKPEECDTPKRLLRGHTTSTGSVLSSSDKKDDPLNIESKVSETSNPKEQKEEGGDESGGTIRRSRKKRLATIQNKEEDKSKKQPIVTPTKIKKESVSEDSSFKGPSDTSKLSMAKTHDVVNPQLLVEKLEKIESKKKTNELSIKNVKKEIKDEYEFDDDASRDSTDVKDFLLRSERRKHSMNDSISSPVVSESTPSSPASTNYGDDPENEKLHRQWKKAIMLVWNEIASHKNASIFLKPITEEKVPGYQSVVYRPMDLQTIKRNMENGVTRTTPDFHRDIMLMFLNAKMYNTDEHLNRMAQEMLKDSVEVIEEFITAQAPSKMIETPVKCLRRETRESSAKRVEERKREERDDKPPTKRRKL